MKKFIMTSGDIACLVFLVGVLVFSGFIFGRWSVPQDYTKAHIKELLPTYGAPIYSLQTQYFECDGKVYEIRPLMNDPVELESGDIGYKIVFVEVNDTSKLIKENARLWCAIEKIAELSEQ